MLRVFLRSAFVLATLLIAHTPAAADTGNDHVLKFNVSPAGYPPYIIVDDKQVSGIVWDVITSVCERLDYRVEPHMIPRKRVDRMLLEGYIDATARAREWTAHPEHFVFSAPIVRVREVFFTVDGAPFDYQVPADLQGMTVLTHLGYRYPYLKEMFESGRAQRFDVPKDRDIFSYLLYGENRFDVAIADELVGHWLIRENGWKGRFNTSVNALTDFGLRLMVRPGIAGFADDFDRELEALRASGELDRIITSYR
ncbi:substrate-binding periplasmic protein [Marinobacter sp. JSM 1782161]|uniref:substrate-binding periplasmic protein n=1 Tax=Marinobacter sp. JSM 1782161 TaxID=2685906 RepID=UPI001D1880E6|nr:ABC transporter substrate-binding protein [Marinobacter sp. JSM 1782161]